MCLYAIGRQTFSHNQGKVDTAPAAHCILAQLGKQLDSTLPGECVKQLECTLPGECVKQLDFTLPGECVKQFDATLPGECAQVLAEKNRKWQSSGAV